MFTETNRLEAMKRSASLPNITPLDVTLVTQNVQICCNGPNNVEHLHNRISKNNTRNCYESNGVT